MSNANDVAREFANKVLMSRTDLTVPGPDVDEDVAQYAERQAAIARDLADTAARTLKRRQAAAVGKRLKAEEQTPDDAEVAAMAIAIARAVADAAEAQLAADRLTLEMLKERPETEGETEG